VHSVARRVGVSTSGESHATRRSPEAAAAGGVRGRRVHLMDGDDWFHPAAAAVRGLAGVNAIPALNPDRAICGVCRGGPRRIAPCGPAQRRGWAANRSCSLRGSCRHLPDGGFGVKPWFPPSWSRGSVGCGRRPGRGDSHGSLVDTGAVALDQERAHGWQPLSTSQAWGPARSSPGCSCSWGVNRLFDLTRGGARRDMTFSLA